jgi:hypothetical protein
VILHRFGAGSRLLNLYVPELTEHLTGAHRLTRLLYSIVRTRRFSPRVIVRLSSIVESPEFIERLCRE